MPFIEMLHGDYIYAELIKQPVCFRNCMNVCCGACMFTPARCVTRKQQICEGGSQRSLRFLSLSAYGI